MTTTENTEQQHPVCECGCCGPAGATAVMEPPTAREKGTDATCQCDCGCTAAPGNGGGCECGCAETGCDCGCGGTSDQG